MIWYLRWTLPLTTGVIAILFDGSPGRPWAAPSWAHPLGADEFGRDLLATTAQTIIVSVLSGLALTAVSLATAGAAAVAAVLLRSRLATIVVTGAGQVVESIPVLLWVLVAVVAIPNAGWLVRGLVFTLAVLPITSRLMIGEFQRLIKEPYLDAARIMQLPTLRILFIHLIPNARSILLPVAIQLCGLAVAVNGAIGIVGFGNRSELNLGTMLWRGKENVLIEPHLLITGLGALVITYLYLWLFLVWGRDTHSSSEQFV
jgi:peptide/nickel transport system permease protein